MTKICEYSKKEKIDKSQLEVCAQNFDWLHKKRKQMQQRFSFSSHLLCRLLLACCCRCFRFALRSGATRTRGQRGWADWEDGEKDDTHAQRQRDTGQTERWPADIDRYAPRQTSRLAFSEWLALDAAEQMSRAPFPSRSN